MNADAVHGPKRVLVTGTTSGIGRALLEHYVGTGATVIAVNRRRRPEVESRFPSVRFECVDVRSVAEVEQLIDRLVTSDELPEAFFLNAGINAVDNDESFDLAAFQTTIDTNLYGVLNFVQPLTRLPRKRAVVHVVAISSMAGYVGNPYGLGYHTSKKALTACFDVWSRMYAGTDLVFQQVVLGPVRTPIYTMADRLPAWMVGLKNLSSVSIENTVRAVARFARSRKKKLFYPRRAVPLYLGAWLCRSLVPGVFPGRTTLSGTPRREPQRATDDGVVTDGGVER